MESPTPVPRLRPRWLYRLAYIWAGIGVAWLLMSGRLVSYFSAFFVSLKNLATSRNGTDPLESASEFNSLCLTAALWLLFITPLMLLAYDLGTQHMQARRVHTGLWRGLRETWRAAWQRMQPDKMAQEFAAPAPPDGVVAFGERFRKARRWWILTFPIFSRIWNLGQRCRCDSGELGREDGIERKLDLDEGTRSSLLVRRSRGRFGGTPRTAARRFGFRNV